MCYSTLSPMKLLFSTLRGESILLSSNGIIVRDFFLLAYTREFFTLGGFKLTLEYFGGSGIFLTLFNNVTVCKSRLCVWSPFRKDGIVRDCGFVRMDMISVAAYFRWSINDIFRKGILLRKNLTIL